MISIKSTPAECSPVPIQMLDGHANMRLDLELLRAADAGRAGWRGYRWDGPWVSLGRFQRPDDALLPGCGVPWVMRPTGGRGVLHGHDLTVAIAAPFDLLCPHPGSRRPVRTAYRAVVQPIIVALRECGLPAELGENTRFASRGGRGSDCFAHVSANDVVDGRTGQKLCGCALRLNDNAVLLQASIPVERPQVDPREVFLDGVMWASTYRIDSQVLAASISAAIRAGFQLGDQMR